MDTCIEVGIYINVRMYTYYGNELNIVCGVLSQEGRLCFSDDTWPDGFSVRKGELVSFQPYAMGRMKYLWGDDAEDFRPERWLDENGNFRQENPFKFTAFLVRR